MSSIVTLLVVVAIIAGVFWLVRQQQATKARELDDAKADARRWVERLGGQVLNLVGTNDAAKQALADAAERYTAAGSQIDQARSAAQARGVTETAYEGLYYVRAARTAMDLDPGPELPPLPGPAAGRRGHRGARGRGAGPPLRRLPEPDGPQHALLPRRHGRRTSRPTRLVLRAAGGAPRWSPAPGAWARPCCSPRCSAACPAWRTPTGSPTARPPTAWTAAWTGGDAGGDVGDGGGDWGGDFGGGDFGGGFGGGDFF